MSGSIPSHRLSIAIVQSACHRAASRMDRVIGKVRGGVLENLVGSRVLAVGTTAPMAIAMGVTL